MCVSVDDGDDEGNDRDAVVVCLFRVRCGAGFEGVDGVVDALDALDARRETLPRVTDRPRG